MLGDFFYPDDTAFARGEMQSREELKSAEDLNVPLPDDNVDFHRLAVRLHGELPRAKRFRMIAPPRSLGSRVSARSWRCF